MNWFKLAKTHWFKKAKEDIPNGKSIGMQYFDIGHSEPTHKSYVNQKYKVHGAKNYLWWWEKGKLNIEEVDKKGKKTHGDILGNDLDNLYQGRAEITPDKKMISVLSPTNMDQRPIPSIIIRSLQNKFGNDIQIVRF